MDEIARVVRYLKALSDPTRLRIVRLMAANDEALCVCELVDSLEEPQYHVSRHLRELRDSGILTLERDGRWTYYRLSERELTVENLARLVANLPAEAFTSDQRRFEERMRLRTDGRCRVGIQKACLADGSQREGATPGVSA